MELFTAGGAGEEMVTETTTAPATSVVVSRMTVSVWRGVPDVSDVFDVSGANDRANGGWSQLSLSKKKYAFVKKIVLEVKVAVVVVIVVVVLRWCHSRDSVLTWHWGCGLWRCGCLGSEVEDIRLKIQ